MQKSSPVPAAMHGLNYVYQTRGKEIESGGANMASASEPKKIFGFAPPVMILEGYISKYFVQFVFSKKPKN